MRHRVCSPPRSGSGYPHFALGSLHPDLAPATRESPSASAPYLQRMNTPKVILSELSRPRNLTRGSSQGRFILRLGMPRVPPTYRCGPCRGWVGLPTEERSHQTLTTVINQVATENWVRSGTIPRSVRPIPRQSGLPDSQWVELVNVQAYDMASPSMSRPGATRNWVRST